MQLTDLLVAVRGGVHYKAAVSRLVGLVQSILGTTVGAADIAARDLLTGLSQYDTVHVDDDGDGKWARYQPTTLDGNGTGTAWRKLSDEDLFALAGSGTNLGVTASPGGVDVTSDTGNNATLPLSTAVNAGLQAPADQAKVANISITQPVDLDAVETAATAAQTAATAAQTAATANTAAILLNTTARHAAATAGGSATTNPVAISGAQVVTFNIAALADLPA